MGKKISLPGSATGTRIQQPATNVFEQLNQLNHPVFCFRNIHRNWSIEHCQTQEQADFINRLFQLSQMTWHQIQFAGKENRGSEKFDINSLKAPLPANITEEVSLLGIKFSGNKRMIGYRTGFIFHVVFINHNHKLYKH